MPDRYPPSVLAAAALAIHRAACPLRDDPDHDCARDAANEELFIPRARAALDAAAPLLAEAWGLDPDPPSAAALRAYLRSRGWAERPPGQAGSLFELPGTNVDVAVLHEGIGDPRFMMETLKRVAEAEGRTPWQVARDIPEPTAIQDDCPSSKMDDGTHSADYGDSGRCAWCGEAGNESAQTAATREDGGS